jgi:hypothetical protein
MNTHPLPFSPHEHIFENGTTITVDLRPVPETLTEFRFTITRNAVTEHDFTFVELCAVAASLEKLLVQYRVHNLNVRTYEAPGT